MNHIYYQTAIAVEDLGPVGKRDDIVDPIANEDSKRVGAKVTIGHHQHRTPIEIFEPYFKCVTNEIAENSLHL